MNLPLWFSVVGKYNKLLQRHKKSLAHSHCWETKPYNVASGIFTSQGSIQQSLDPNSKSSRLKIVLLEVKQCPRWKMTVKITKGRNQNIELTEVFFSSMG